MKQPFSSSHFSIFLFLFSLAIISCCNIAISLLVLLKRSGQREIEKIGKKGDQLQFSLFLSVCVVLYYD